MPGYILLAGGAEFSGAMAPADQRAIELSGGYGVPVAVLPTAAALDHNDRRAGNNGVRWFTSLGVQRVTSVPVINPATANDPALAEQLRSSRLVYLLGGFPGYLCRTLSGSLTWAAVLDAYHQGAVLAGSSAGAMVLCSHFYDPYEDQLLPGLSLLANACVLPHHDRSGSSWAARLREALPGATLIGIDEGTALIDDGETGRWTVYGRGAVTIYRDDVIRKYNSRSPSFDLIE